MEAGEADIEGRERLDRAVLARSVSVPRCRPITDIATLRRVHPDGCPSIDRKSRIVSIRETECKSGSNTALFVEIGLELRVGQIHMRIWKIGPLDICRVNYLDVPPSDHMG